MASRDKTKEHAMIFSVYLRIKLIYQLYSSWPIADPSDPVPCALEDRVIL